MEQFQTGTVVWARIMGWPWWPAVVVERAFAEHEMEDELLVSLTPPAEDNRMLMFFNYQDCYDVVETKKIREFVHNFNQDMLRKVNRHPKHVSTVQKAAEIALAWIVNEGSENQRQALINKPLVEHLCRTRKIKFPKIRTHVEPSISISRNSLGKDSFGTSSKKETNQSKEESNEAFFIHEDESMDLAFHEETIESGNGNSFGSDEHLQADKKLSPSPTQKFEVEKDTEYLATSARLVAQELQAPTPSNAVDKLNSLDREEGLPNPGNETEGLIDSELSLDLFGIPLPNYKPSPCKHKFHTTRAILRTVSKSNHDRVSRDNNDLAHFDFEESSTIKKGDYNDLQTPTLTNNEIQQQDELQTIKKDAKQALLLLEIVVARIEKIEEN